MFQNNLKIALRNLLRNKLHSGINILGLAIGISACLTMMLIIDHEYSFDRDVPSQENIYRIYTKYDGKGFQGTNPGAGGGFVTALAEEPGVTHVAPLYHIPLRAAIKIKNE